MKFINTQLKRWLTADMAWCCIILSIDVRLMCTILGIFVSQPIMNGWTSSLLLLSKSIIIQHNICSGDEWGKCEHSYQNTGRKKYRYPNKGKKTENTELNGNSRWHIHHTFWWMMVYNQMSCHHHLILIVLSEFWLTRL